MVQLGFLKVGEASEQGFLKNVDERCQTMEGWGFYVGLFQKQTHIQNPKVLKPLGLLRIEKWAVENIVFRDNNILYQTVELKFYWWIEVSIYVFSDGLATNYVGVPWVLEILFLSAR